jgi:glucosylceramidase
MTDHPAATDPRRRCRWYSSALVESDLGGEELKRTGLVLGLLLAAGVAGGGVAYAATPAQPVKAAPKVNPFPTVQVVQTSQNLSQALAPVGQLKFTATQPSLAQVIHVADSARYQPIVGVGGAMTDSSAWLLYTQLSGSVFRATMNKLFGPNGIHLGFIRLPMGGSDFTAEGYPYTYDDIPIPGSDPTLSQFSIGHDRPYIIPALRAALKLNPAAQIIATPWTPPRFMKTNDNFDNTNNGSFLLPSYYAVYADYFVKFLRAYAQAKVPVTAITPQNEPGNSTWYPGLNLPATDEATFIANYLKPALRQARLKTQIFGFDYHWQYALPYIGTLLGSPAGADLAGIATHCYAGTPTVMSALHGAYPSLQQWVTECTTQQAFATWIPSELEIASLRNWASAVDTWNLALDPAGGPVQAPNTACQGCNGLLTVDERTHQVSFNNGFYQLGQLSKFLKPGAVRISSNHFVQYSPSGPGPGLDDVAFRNPDGTEGLLAYNNSTASARFAVLWHNKSFVYSLPAGATATFSWNSR